MMLLIHRDNGIFATSEYRRTLYARGQHLFPTYANLINGYARECAQPLYMYVYIRTMRSNDVFITVQGPLEARCRTLKISIHFRQFYFARSIKFKKQEKIHVITILVYLILTIEMEIIYFRTRVFLPPGARLTNSNLKFNFVVKHNLYTFYFLPIRYVFRKLYDLLLYKIGYNRNAMKSKSSSLFIIK